MDVDPAARKTAERMVKCAGYKRFVDFAPPSPQPYLDHTGAVAGAAVVADTTETPLSLMHDAMKLVGELRPRARASLRRRSPRSPATDCWPVHSTPSPSAPSPSCQ